MTDTPQPEPEAVPFAEERERKQELVAQQKQRGIPALISSDDEIRRCFRIADGLYASGMFKDLKKPEEAFAKILIGRDLGISPTQALLTIDLVKGNIFMRGVLLAAFVRKSKDYDYRILEQTDEKCRVMFFDRDPVTGAMREAGESSFSMDDAAKAGIINDNYKKIPRNMLFYRAISNGVKFMAPDLLGGVPVYTEADPIPEARSLGAGTGNGEPEGIPLPPAVEAVIARATELGNATLADRGTIEMAVDGQPEEFVENWVREANEILDATADAKVSEAIDGEAEDA